ncbi:TIM barrel protein (plasmid) [Rhizobium grahamii]|uniref:TIM barrel protein n=1 Tax=Rhizobium grahamii TaxID=1120045 RepID=A0A5Q0CHR3_9HYPH|nr:TIM barrel protein [Rhizobium grahamii]QRM53126.1 TIM barrel protein [Rhizobium sp. BG6]
MKFALNHITAPALDSRQFVDLAARLGCMGVELRNDLADKELTSRAFFDGARPADVGKYAREKGIRLLGLSEVYGFNRWSEAMREKVELLISQAKESGAETISLIPSNDGVDEPTEQRLAGLRNALAAILPMLEEQDLVGLVEPLGFTTSSLRLKREAVDAFEAVGGKDRFRLVHDTFHHHLADETEFFPQWTGIVHISGVVDASLRPEDMQDKHRILVTEADRLGNVEQIKHLNTVGYQGAYSFELFSPLVHADPNIEIGLRTSMDVIKAALRN